MTNTQSSTKALIVDDERLARLDLRHVLTDFSDVEICGEAANASEAETMIQSLQSDVVFLDIRMPDGSGFDLLERLESAPTVVFTTAYDEYALRAFEINALDYLLKPIEKDCLKAALERVRHLVSEKIVSERIGSEKIGSEKKGSSNTTQDETATKTLLQADSRVFFARRG